MKEILYGLIVSIFMYFTYYLVIIKKPIRLKRYINNSRETKMIKDRYKLNYDKLNHKMVANYFALANSLMIGVAFFVVSFVKNYVLKLLVAFVTLSFLTIFLYLQIGKIFKKKEGISCTITKK